MPKSLKDLFVHIRFLPQIQRVSSSWASSSLSSVNSFCFRSCSSSCHRPRGRYGSNSQNEILRGVSVMDLLFAPRSVCDPFRNQVCDWMVAYLNLRPIRPCWSGTWTGSRDLTPKLLPPPQLAMSELKHFYIPVHLIPVTFSLEYIVEEDAGVWQPSTANFATVTLYTYCSEIFIRTNSCISGCT